jgi:hypothetical protein
MNASFKNNETLVYTHMNFCLHQHQLKIHVSYIFAHFKFKEGNLMLGATLNKPFQAH